MECSDNNKKQYKKICDLVLIGNIANKGIELILENKKNEIIDRFGSFYFNYINDNINNDKSILLKLYELMGLDLDSKKNISKSIDCIFNNDVLKYIDKRNNKNKQIPNSQFIDKEQSFAIFNVNKGGILTCLYVICDSFNAGLRYDMSIIPIRQETIEICDYYKLNAYRLFTSDIYVFCVNNYFNFKNNLYSLIDEKIKNNKFIALLKEYLDNYMVLFGELNNLKAKIRIDIETKSFLEKSYMDEINKIVIL